MGNSLGSFMEVDMSFLQSGAMCLGKFLVLLDLSKGLVEDLQIECGDRVFSQPLDYVGVPFHCNKCHHYGHVYSQCGLSFKKYFRPKESK